MHYFSISSAPSGKSTPTGPTSHSKETQHGAMLNKMIKSEIKVDHEVTNTEDKVENDDKKKNSITEHNIDDVKIVGTKPIVISLFGKKSDADKNTSSKTENSDVETSENTFEDHQLLDEEEEKSPWNHVCEHCTQVFENDKCLNDHITICNNKHKTTPIKVQNIAKIEKCESPERKMKPHVKDSDQSASEEILNVNKQLTTDDVNVSSTNTAEDSKLKKVSLNCDVCDYIAFSSQNLITHKKKNIQNPIPCPKCPFKSCSERGLKNHQKALHHVQEELVLPVDVNNQLTNLKETEMDIPNCAEVIF